MGPVSVATALQGTAGPILIYLLHFDQPIAGKQHYLGSTVAGSLEKRLRRHHLGTGSGFTRRMHEASIGFRIAALWQAPDRSYERTLKLRGRYQRHCAICSPQGNVHAAFPNVLCFPPIAPKIGSCILSWGKSVS